MYNYQSERPKLFAEANSVMFMAVRDNVKNLLSMAGAVRMQEALHPASGDGWTMLAMVDRLVELGELREVTPNGVAGQDRVFVAG